MKKSILVILLMCVVASSCSKIIQLQVNNTNCSQINNIENVIIRKLYFKSGSMVDVKKLIFKDDICSYIKMGEERKYTTYIKEIKKIVLHVDNYKLKLKHVVWGFLGGAAAGSILAIGDQGEWDKLWNVFSIGFGSFGGIFAGLLYPGFKGNYIYIYTFK